MKITHFICIMILSYHITFAENKISGKITDQDNLPLIGASVYIPDLNKGTVSNNNGDFELLDLPNGRIKIKVSYIGFTPAIETLDLSGQNVELNIKLEQSYIECEEIVISGSYNTAQHENAVKIDVLKLNTETYKSTPNFVEMLTQVAGVDMISKGSGISKPVIRGLSMNDILVLNNGVRFENYQYSSHHPMGIDEFGIEDVEIIKGPASLLYGSDAIGGIINFIKEKPAPVGSIVGDYNMQVFSNTQGVTNNLGIKGTSNKFFGGIRFGQKSNSDFLQGGGIFAPNSRFNEISFKSNAGITDKIGVFKIYYDYNNQKLGLVEDKAIETITQRGRENEIWYQEFNTHLLSSQNKIYLGEFKLDINSAFQNTELIHFGEAETFELQMKLLTLTYEAKIHFPSKENSEYIIGFQGFNQTNSNLNDRETKLLPDATTTNYSAFGLLQYTFFTKLKLQTGLRYDIKSISTKAAGLPSETDTYRAPIDKNFANYSGSIGGTYHLTEDFLLRTNLAAAYRTPTIAELTSNGQHELRFEIGDQNLIPENAYETDLSMHLHKPNFTFDIAGFYNAINNYIFIAPSGDTTLNGINIYNYKQANSVLYGGEAGINIHPASVKWLNIESTFSSVIGKQNNGDYLPFIPANKLNFEILIQKEKLLFLQKVFISINTNTAFSQNNVTIDETSTTDYTLLNLSIGGSVKLEKQIISINLSANNILDKKYIDHLSTLKEVNIYNPGRNISFSLRFPFVIKNY